MSKPDRSAQKDFPPRSEHNAIPRANQATQADALAVVSAPRGKTRSLRRMRTLSPRRGRRRSCLRLRSERSALPTHSGARKTAPDDSGSAPGASERLPTPRMPDRPHATGIRRCRRPEGADHSSARLVRRGGHAANRSRA